MDNGAHKILESTTLRTLRAQHFSRASAQASAVLTDVLARYYALLLGTCSKYATQAGRTNLTARDALGALEELGVGVDELADYIQEAKDMRAYAVQSQRMTEDLNIFKAALADGLRQDRDDVQELFYGPNPGNEDDENLPEEEQLGSEEEMSDVEMSEPQHDANGTAQLPVHTAPTDAPPHPRTPPRTLSPPLPLSPVSNPSSPSRKRLRRSSWSSSHPHIPSFLPPLPHVPSASDPIHRSPSPMSVVPTAPQPLSVAAPQPEKLVNGTATAKPAPVESVQHATSASASDYTTPIPYGQSSLAGTPEWHLPTSAPPATPSAARRPTDTLPTPRTQPALIGAYHHILTHPPPKDAIPAGHPARHRIALSLMDSAQQTPRWEPPDSVFASSVPSAPRMAGPAPSFAIPITSTPTAVDGTEQGGKERVLPSVPPRIIAGAERLAPLITEQGSRLPDLARTVLPNSLYKRATRLNHPPVLTRGNQKLVYGPAINAPWNSSLQPLATPAGGIGPSLANGITGKEEGLGKSKDGKDAAPKIPDARLYATWDYEQKHFWEPLPVSRALKAKGAQVFLRDAPVPGPGAEGNKRMGSGLTIQVGRRDSIASGRQNSMHSAS